MSDTFLQVTSFDPLIISEPQGSQGPQGQIGPAGPVGPPGGVVSVNGQTGVVDLSGHYVPLATGVTATITGDPANPDVSLYVNGVEL
jgi:hypothetical protein